MFQKKASQLLFSSSPVGQDSMIFCCKIGPYVHSWLADFLCTFLYHFFVPLVEVKWKLHGRQVNRGAGVKWEGYRSSTWNESVQLVIWSLINRLQSGGAFWNCKSVAFSRVRFEMIRCFKAGYWLLSSWWFYSYVSQHLLLAATCLRTCMHIFKDACQQAGYWLLSSCLSILYAVANQCWMLGDWIGRCRGRFCFEF